MAAATITELSVLDISQVLVSGTAPKRRAVVHVRYTSAATSDTITLGSYVKGVADIEGVIHNSMNSAISGTAITWDSATASVAGHSGVGLGECALVVNFT